MFGCLGNYHAGNEKPYPTKRERRKIIDSRKCRLVEDMSVPRRVYFLFVQSVILFTFCDGKSPLLCFFAAFQPPKLNQSYPISRHQLFRGSLETCSKVDDFRCFLLVNLRENWMMRCDGFVRKAKVPRTPSLKVTWHFPWTPSAHEKWRFLNPQYMGYNP